MGENGAGKSTLIKALTGVYTIDGGQVLVEGEPHEFHSPAASQAAGISTVYQEVNLVPNLTVAENMMLGREPRRFGSISVRDMNRRARRTLLHLGVDIDPRSDARRAPDRDPAARGDRPRRRRRGQGAHPRRADLQPRLRRGREALHGHAPPARRGRGHRLRLPLPRPDLRDRRPDDDPAQRPARRGAAGLRDHPARAGPLDDRSRARDPRPPRPRGPQDRGRDRRAGPQGRRPGPQELPRGHRPRALRGRGRRHRRPPRLRSHRAGAAALRRRHRRHRRADVPLRAPQAAQPPARHRPQDRLLQRGPQGRGRGRRPDRRRQHAARAAGLPRLAPPDPAGDRAPSSSTTTSRRSTSAPPTRRR